MFSKSDELLPKSLGCNKTKRFIEVSKILSNLFFYLKNHRFDSLEIFILL